MTTMTVGQAEQRLCEHVDRVFRKRFGDALRDRVVHDHARGLPCSEMRDFLDGPEHAESFARRYEENRRTRERAVQAIRERARGRIVDIGCGDGVLTAAMGAAAGVDEDADNIRWARAAFPHIRFSNCDIKKCRLDHSYHTIVLCRSLHELSAPRTALRNLRRSLAEGGNLLIIEQADYAQRMEVHLRATNYVIVGKINLGIWHQHCRFREMVLIEAGKARPATAVPTLRQRR